MDKAATLTGLLGQIKPDLNGVARAYCFARFSVQNRLRFHEAAFTRFVAAYPTWDAMHGQSLQGYSLNFWRAIDRDLQAALPVLPRFIAEAWGLSDKEARAWVAENVPGLGYAKASFFLMLLGRLDVGCLDVHMLALLKTGKVAAPKTRAAYERIEKKLGAKAGLKQWLRWIDHMGIEGIGHGCYFAAQGCT